MRRFKKSMRSLTGKGLLLLSLFAYKASTAQVTGGQAAFEYLRLANSPHISALGGFSVGMPTNDIAFAIQNPSLMRPGLHNQLGLNYNRYYADINVMNLQYGYHAEKLNTSFVLGVQYLNYGKMSLTDAIGNVYGDFTPVDYAVSIGASRQYREHWRYGAALKFAGSQLHDKSAAALLADIGVNYYDTTSLLDIGIVAKNMGGTLKKYDPNNSAEPLPFDLQIGISKRFKHIPLRLFATIHHLYEWDIRYNDPAMKTSSTLIGADSGAKEKSYFADKFFRHFIFGTELTIAKRLTLTVAYNHLRRGELALTEKKGAAGFSFGAGLDLNKLQVHYARSYYHIAGAYNEFGLNLALNRLVGIGEAGEKIGWSKQYPNW